MLVLIFVTERDGLRLTSTCQPEKICSQLCCGLMDEIELKEWE
ncbi:hypothetical protein [Lysinibacillus cavernae]|nr:hypothetical protein [Lysinibacillus cavernae]